MRERTRTVHSPPITTWQYVKQILLGFSLHTQKVHCLLPLMMIENQFEWNLYLMESNEFLFFSVHLNGFEQWPSSEKSARKQESHFNGTQQQQALTENGKQ